MRELVTHTEEEKHRKQLRSNKLFHFLLTIHWAVRCKAFRWVLMNANQRSTGTNVEFPVHSSFWASSWTFILFPDVISLKVSFHSFRWLYVYLFLRVVSVYLLRILFRSTVDMMFELGGMKNVKCKILIWSSIQFGNNTRLQSETTSLNNKIQEKLWVYTRAKGQPWSQTRVCTVSHLRPFITLPLERGRKQRTAAPNQKQPTGAFESKRTFSST